jgi:hypothetical protein
MTTATTSTKYASVDPANDDEIARLWLERAIVELAETLGTERLYKGQAEEIADEMSDLQHLLDDLDRNAPGWSWLQRIDRMDEPPTTGTTYTHDGIDWDLQ